MKRFILFSAPTPTNIDSILNLIFPKEINNKVFSYMPSDGANCKQQYREEWQGYAEKYNARFQYIDNSTNDSREIDKLLKSNILIITGGNTFKLLHNLRNSGLDNAIKEFAKKDEFVLSGFSAGALVLTPTIKICNLPNYDENLVRITDLAGLNLVDFEVFPHYEEIQHKSVLNKYRSTTKNEVKEIANDNYLVINL